MITILGPAFTETVASEGGLSEEVFFDAIYQAYVDQTGLGAGAIYAHPAMVDRIRRWQQQRNAVRVIFAGKRPNRHQLDKIRVYGETKR